MRPDSLRKMRFSEEQNLPSFRLFVYQEREDGQVYRFLIYRGLYIINFRAYLPNAYATKMDKFQRERGQGQGQGQVYSELKMTPLGREDKVQELHRSRERQRDGCCSLKTGLHIAAPL